MITEKEIEKAKEVWEETGLAYSLIIIIDELVKERDNLLKKSIETAPYTG